MSKRLGAPGRPAGSDKKATGCCIKVPFDDTAGQVGNYNERQIFGKLDTPGPACSKAN